MVRKRILPLIKDSLHPQYTKDKSEIMNFLPLNNATIEKLLNDMSYIVNNDKNNITKKEDNNDENDTNKELKSEKNKNIYVSNEGVLIEVGECTSSHENNKLSSGLIRLEKVLPKDPSGRINKCIIIDNIVDSQSISTDTDLISENPGLSGNPGSDPESVFVPFRPPWWLDFDPITHKRLDTHED